MWHKISNGSASFGSGSVASLVDVNSATVNGMEHVIMGGGYSPIVSGAMT